MNRAAHPSIPFLRRVRIFIVPVFAIFVSLFAVSAGAQNIHFDNVAIPNGDYTLTAVDAGVVQNIYYAGEIDISVTQIQGVNITPALVVPTFCIQLDQDVSVGGSYTTYTVESLTSDTILTAVAARDLATLYYLFYKGNVTSDWTATTAAAFQLDCWKIVQDPGNYSLTATTGVFYVTSTGTEVNLAQTWLTAVSGTVATSGSTQPLALADPTYQDLLYTETVEHELIPFHVGALPGAVLLGAIGFLRIRNRLLATG